jgi:epoxide hydrolase-like predicted phosphatase
MSRDGLIVDWGGVMTTDVFASFEDFCRAEGMDPDTVRNHFRHDETARQLLFDLETGRIREVEFEPHFAAVLGVPADGLIDRLFASMQADEPMVEAVAAARRAGVRTGLLSNSWGDDRYDRSRFAELFDAVVISSEVGLRKPDPEIYALACERLGLPPERCVFVDDLGGNLKPAAAIGIATVKHTDAAATIAELEELLGVSLR